MNQVLHEKYTTQQEKNDKMYGMECIKLKGWIFFEGKPTK